MRARETAVSTSSLITHTSPFFITNRLDDCAATETAVRGSAIHHHATNTPTLNITHLRHIIIPSLFTHPFSLITP
ncbi:MAG: hypothetical protein KC443_19845, partial [Anaerolineales bacterium]|nr:hypothetical protein [Anaerolineales bacterium]